MLINKQLSQHRAPWVIWQDLEPPAEEAEMAASEADAKPPAPSRWSETLLRNDKLDETGVKPVPRTLGSRFRSGRRRR